MPSSVKLVRPLPPAAILSSQIRKQLKRNLKPLARQHTFFRQVLVAKWKPEHQPKFRGVITSDRNTVSLDIVIANGDKRIDKFTAATINDLWKWWEFTGTKRHIIRHVRAKALRFTVPGNFVDPVIFALKVRHPGTKPKRLTRKINKKLQGRMSTIIQTSTQEGIRGN